MKLVNNEPPPGASPREAEKWRQAERLKKLKHRAPLTVVQVTRKGGTEGTITASRTTYKNPL